VNTIDQLASNGLRKMPTLLLPVTSLLGANRKRLGPMERLLREHARWSKLLDSPILSPRSYHGRDFSIAGAAFDYWLRAFLAIEFGHPAFQEATVLSQWLETHRDESYFDETLFEYPEGNRSLRVLLHDVVQARRAAIQAKEINSPAFFENCIDHGQLEGLYRSDQMRDLSCNPSDMIGDLNKLAQAVQERRPLFSGSRVDTNPRFPRDIFAADGDLAIDDRLLEIKTTADVIQPLAFVQTVCYVIVEAWQRGPSLSALRYSEVAVYSARHGALGVVALAEVATVLSDIRAFLQEMAMHTVAKPFGPKKRSRL
jgi:hypothetical protein